MKNWSDLFLLLINCSIYCWQSFRVRSVNIWRLFIISEDHLPKLFWPVCHVMMLSISFHTTCLSFFIRKYQKLRKQKMDFSSLLWFWNFSHIFCYLAKKAFPLSFQSMKRKRPQTLHLQRQKNFPLKKLLNY